MKILLHCNYDPYSSIGGIETACRDIASAIASQHDVTIIASGKTESRYSRNNLDIKILKSLFTISGANFAWFQNIKMIWMARESDRVILQEPCPSYWPAVALIKLFGISSITVYVHAIPRIRYAYLRRVYLKMFRWLHESSFLVTSSPNLQQQLSECIGLNAFVLPFSVEDRSDILASSRFLEVKIPNRYCLYLGRLAHYKGLDMIMNAADGLPNVNFVVAGVGEMSGLFQNSSRTNLFFINEFVSDELKNFLISKSEFLLFPSNSQNEAFGIIQVEALSHGKPILNTNLGTGVNWVSPAGVTGLTVEVGDQVEFNRCVEVLWSDVATLQKLSMAARKRYLLVFSKNKFAEFWLKHLG
jgi:glycosyltransferase involved in cell wall biosynthesis